MRAITRFTTTRVYGRATAGHAQRFRLDLVDTLPATPHVARFPNAQRVPCRTGGCLVPEVPDLVSWFIPWLAISPRVKMCL